MVYVRKVFILLILLVFISPAYAATIYKWVDEEGIVNYTDDYNKVPTLYLDRVKILEFFTEKGPPVQTPQTTPGIKEETGRIFMVEMRPGGGKRCVRGRNS